MYERQDAKLAANTLFRELPFMTMNITLGQAALYADSYDPSMLGPIPRSHSRVGLWGEKGLPFSGKDIWTCYELSWLDASGKPQVAIGEFEFSFNSYAIIESKSFKYYLNSFNQTRYKSWQHVSNILKHDLSQACGGTVEVSLFKLGNAQALQQLPGFCVDDLVLEKPCYSPDARLLKLAGAEKENAQLFSHLLKSNCPVTGQPDWASVWLEYSGLEILGESFLAYIVSFRQHQDFHENCVEKIFTDILKQCSPRSLSVYARYTRRGGLDINPFRSNCRSDVPFNRVARQ
ncbi:MAG: 7-cyano-7-deazaguanine reductase [Lentisphaeria bacterium]